MKLTRTVMVVVGLAFLAAGCAGPAATATSTSASPVSAARALPRPFTITMRYTAKSLGLDHPDALAIGPDGNLYVTDLSQRVTVISPAGQVLRRWGKPGSGPGEFKFIGGDPTDPTDIHGKIAIGADGTVYVSDSGNARVEAFNAQGKFIRQFGSFGTGTGRFLHPFDIAVDKSGCVYVVDGQTDTLFKFSRTGKVLWQIFGAPEDLGGSGCCYHFASFDRHDRLVLINDGRGRVLYIDSTGHTVDAFLPDVAAFPGGNMCEVTVDAAGNTYVTGCGPGPTGPAPTLVYDRTHGLVAKWPGAPYSLRRSPVFGPRGEVFVLATDGSILKLHITLSGA